MNNMKHGEGYYMYILKNLIYNIKNRWPDKTCYMGNWKEDKYHGYGIKSWADGDNFEGFWKDDKKHGILFLF